MFRETSAEKWLSSEPLHRSLDVSPGDESKSFEALAALDHSHWGVGLKYADHTESYAKMGYFEQQLWNFKIGSKKIFFKLLELQYIYGSNSVYILS